MPTGTEKTAPKPFVFVLMPFDKSFEDIYLYGIKGAAQDIGAYAERVDEQIYQEGILDRIFNQINKADVIVADMTGRNPNVFYEVGYAHALNKVVILLTQTAEDIPFDLKHRQHVVYGGHIEELRKVLRTRLRWAINESTQNDAATAQHFTVYLSDRELTPSTAAEPTVLEVTSWRPTPDDDSTARLRLAIRNDSDVASEPIGHVYVFAAPESRIYPASVLNAVSGSQDDAVPMRLGLPARPSDAYDGLSLQYHLKGEIPRLPPGGIVGTVVAFHVTGAEMPVIERFRLRIHTSDGTYDFSFNLHAHAKELRP